LNFCGANVQHPDSRPTDHSNKNDVFIKRSVHVRCFATPRADILADIVDAILDDIPKKQYYFFMKIVKEFELLRLAAISNKNDVFIKRGVRDMSDALRHRGLTSWLTSWTPYSRSSSRSLNFYGANVLHPDSRPTDLRFFKMFWLSAASMFDVLRHCGLTFRTPHQMIF
jgi:hypothetical protein